MTTLAQYLFTPDLVTKYQEVNQDENFYYFYKHYWINEKKDIFQIFENLSFKYSLPKDFNDPFDCHFGYEITFTDFTKENFLEYLRKSGRCSEQELKKYEQNWPKQKDYYLEVVKTACNHGQFPDYRENFGVVCMNSNPLSILMWSHYTNSHKGFCIEFKFPKITNYYEDLPLPITYSEKYPILIDNWNNTKFSTESRAEHIKKTLLTKAHQWSYENEFRLIKAEGEGFEKIEPELFSSVIMGVDMGETDKLLLKKSIEKFNLNHQVKLEIYQAELAKKVYGIEVTNHPRLSK